jgi:pimeloyl-ACP methyl ester carboxylesterase
MATTIAVTVVAVVIVYRVWFSVDDPASARCPHPPSSMGAQRQFADHREIDVTYTCAGAALAGTIYLPSGPGPHPGVVWVHGAGEAARLTWGGQMLPGLVHAGLAVLSYDKRGVGQSQGVCCPGDQGHFNLLTADAAGAITVLRARADIQADRIGLAGASQAGWIAPRAADRAGAAFVALASAPAVPERTANLYERLSRGEEGKLSRPEIARRLHKAGSSGFDPLPDLKRMTMPGLWLFGTADDHTPVQESVAILNGLKAQGHDVTIQVFPDAGHGLLDNPPTAPAAPQALIDWIAHQVHASARSPGS